MPANERAAAVLKMAPEDRGKVLEDMSPEQMAETLNAMPSAKRG